MMEMNLNQTIVYDAMLVVICISLALLFDSYGFIEDAIKSTKAVIRKEERRSDLRKACGIFAGASSYFSNMLRGVQ